MMPNSADGTGATDTKPLVSPDLFISACFDATDEAGRAQTCSRKNKAPAITTPVSTPRGRPAKAE
jgi:hypothetical protein